MGRPNSLYLRIFLPFCIAVVSAALIAWAIATYLIAESLETNRRAQLENAIVTIVDKGLPWTADLLLRVAELQQAELIVFTDSGVLLSTLAGTDEPIHRLDAASERGEARLELDGVEYAFTSYHLEPSKNQISRVALLGSLADARSAAWQIAVGLGLAAIGIIALLAYWGHRITRSVASPISELVRVTGSIGAGARSVDAPRSDVREISALGQAISQMADRLSAFEDELAERNRLAALGELASQIAHELRNPLTAIKLQVQMLGERLSDEASKNTTARLLGELQRLELIVTNTLAVRSDSRLELRPTDLNEVTLDVLELMAPSLKHRNIRLASNLNDLPRAQLDADRLKQVIFNAVNNAADALPNGGDIRVSSEITSDAIVMTIEDSGHGFDHETRAKLDRGIGTTTKPGGSGLGLHVSREVVEQHGGHLEFGASTDLGGARLAITLPVVCAESHQTAQ